jgi:integrase
MVQDYLDGRILDAEISQKTANEYRVCLHTLFEYAVKYRGYISGDPQFANPIKRVRRFRVSAREIRFLTIPQIREQLQALTPWPKSRAMVAMYIYAGVRRAEALWLTIDDVKLSGSPPLLHIRSKEVDGEFWEPKTKVPRVVPISKALRAILSEYAGSTWHGGEWFFPSPKGCRYDGDNFSHAFTKLQKRLGLPWTCLDFRHTFGSQLAQKGESLYKISTLLGNSPEICRKHYAALVPEKMAEAVEFGHDCKRRLSEAPDSIVVGTP